MTLADAQNTRILIVDDERDIVDLVTYNLSRQGYKVTAASDGEEALDRIKRETFQLIILDLMLPGLQGVEICRILRRNPKTAALPIIMLTAKTELNERIEGLETGADDYMTKPFSPKELIARVNAVMRRAGGTIMSNVISIGALKIDKERFSISKHGKALDLSATEFAILLFLAERRGRVFTREQLLDAVWKDNTFIEPRTIDVHVRRLRAQIEDDPARPEYIRTRRGVGYYVDEA